MTSSYLELPELIKYLKIRKSQKHNQNYQKIQVEKSNNTNILEHGELCRK